MATPATINGDNTTTSNSVTSPAPSPEKCYWYNGPGAYIIDLNEWVLYKKWLFLPRSDLQLATYNIKAFWSSGRRIIARPELELEVATTMTPEQEKRFAIVAQLLEIHHAVFKLDSFRKQMVEIRDELEAEKEDALADFDPEDFKRLEKENRR